MILTASGQRFSIPGLNRHKQHANTVNYKRRKSAENGWKYSHLRIDSQVTIKALESIERRDYVKEFGHMLDKIFKNLLNIISDI